VKNIKSFCERVVVIISLLIFSNTISQSADFIKIGEWQGLPRGSANDVAVSGNYAYVADGSAGLLIIDISNPSNPVRVGWYDTSGSATKVAISGNYAFVADGPAGLQIINISNRSNPVWVGGYDTTGYASDVSIFGNYAYVADGKAGLQIIDISNITNPVKVGAFNTLDETYGVAVSGNYAYVADGLAGLQIINISNPSNPVKVGECIGSRNNFFDLGYAYKVTVSGNYAYVAFGSDGLQIIDISDPARPKRVGEFNPLDHATEIAVYGNYAFMVGEALYIIDINDPLNPRCVGKYDQVGNLAGVTVSGNYAYLVEDNEGLQVINISSPANPVRVGGYGTSGTAMGIAVSGNYAYVADGAAGVQTIDIRNPSNPLWVGGYDTTGSAQKVVISGNYAYIADYNAGLQIINISDPSNPVRVGGYDTFGDPRDLVVSGNYAYVVYSFELFGTITGFDIIDISNPSNPVRIGGWSVENADHLATAIAVSGNYAYLAATTAGLQIIDIKNPSNPVKVGGYNTTNSFAKSIAVSGNYAYVADGNTGLEIIDIRNPSNPIRVGGYGTAGPAMGVTVSSNYAFVANGNSGLQVIDVSNPSNPVRVGGYDKTSADAVAVSGNYIFVADYDDGVYILSTTPVTPVSYIQFSSSSYSVNENEKFVVLTVNRSWSSNGVASVNYSTVNGIASDGLDFTAVSGTLTWADGDGSPKTITIPIIDDNICEGNKTFSAKLSGVSGASLGRLNNVTVTIFDNELTVPKVLEPSNVSSNSFVARWNAVNGARGYQLDIAVDDKFINYVNGYQHRDVGNVTSYFVVGLSSGVTYFYRVRAYGENITSDESVTISVTTIGPISVNFINQWPGYPRGNAYSVAVSGKYAFVAAQEGGLQIIDISNPPNPTRIGGYNTSGTAMGIAVSGNNAYVADGDAGLQIIDIGKPSSPIWVSEYGTADYANGVAVSGNYAYVTEDSGLEIIDISKRSDPVWVGEYGTTGYANAVALSGNFAYVTAEDAGLQIIDISNPADPVLVGKYDTRGYAYGIAISGNFAYVADYDAGLQVINVSDPSDPIRVGGYSVNSALGVAVSGSYVYLADGRSGLHIIGISNPSNPVSVGTCDIGGYANAVAISGNYACVADGDAGLQIVDTSNPSNPARLAGYNTSGDTFDVTISGDYAYIADGAAGLQIIDIKNPSNPVRVGGYDTTGYAHSAAVSGNYALVSDGNAGLQIIDIKNPSNPVRVGGYDTIGNANDVAVSGHYAYVADYDGGLQIIDISIPLDPVRVGRFNTGDYALGVAVSGNYAYVAAGNAGLQIINISNPSNPISVGTYHTSGCAHDVAVSGNYAYVADEDAGLQIIDISNPSNPKLVWFDKDSIDYALGVLVSGNYVYLADGDDGLQIINISNPLNPVRVGGYDTVGYTYGVAVSRNYIFVADGKMGMQILSTTTVTPVSYIRFSSSSYIVNENEGYIVLTVNRTGSSNGVVHVSYSTANGTATAGADFTAFNGTLSWADGDISPKTITIPITNDGVYESNETFSVNLIDASGASLDVPSNVVVTIIDDDLPCAFSISPTNWAAPSSGGSTTVTVIAGSGCDWTVDNPYSSWVTISPISGIGNGSVTVTLSSNNTGRTRTGILAIAGQSFTITQLSQQIPGGRTMFITSAVGNPGGVVKVPINLISKGDENAFGLSIGFDTNALTFISIEKGSNALSTSILINSNQIAYGKIGVACALPVGAAFSSGTQQVMVVSFQIGIKAQAGEIPVVFSDSPVAREVSSVGAQPLDCAFSDGTIIVFVGYEADATPRPNGNNNGTVTTTDWVQCGRFAAGLDTPAIGSEFQRADCAPRSTLGDGRITTTDWVQAGRYAAGLDPVTLAGGPTSSINQLMPSKAKISSSQCIARIGNVNGQYGVISYVSVYLESSGQEVALGFTVVFNTTELKFVDVSSQLTNNNEGTILVNTNFADNGLVGFQISRPMGEPFPAGTNEVIRLAFIPTVSSGTSFIAFGDSPVIREVSDVNAIAISASFENGYMTIVPSTVVKVLSIPQISGNLFKITLSQLPGSTNILQASSNLVEWINLGNYIIPPTGFTNIFLVPPFTDHGFFRAVLPN